PDRRCRPRHDRGRAAPAREPALDDAERDRDGPPGADDRPHGRRAGRLLDRQRPPVRRGAAAAGRRRPRGRLLIVDCDVHNYPASPEALHPYLPAHWREHLEQTVFKGASEPTVYPPNAPTTVRPDARPAEGPPGSSLELLREHLTA